MYVSNIVNILCLDVAIIVCIYYVIIFVCLFVFMGVREYGDDFNQGANYHHCLINMNFFIWRVSPISLGRKDNR